MNFTVMQKHGRELTRNAVVMLLGYPYRVCDVRDDPARNRFVVEAVYCGGDPDERAVLRGFVKMQAGLKKNLLWNVRILAPRSVSVTRTVIVAGWTPCNGPAGTSSTASMTPTSMPSPTGALDTTV